MSARDIEAARRAFEREQEEMRRIISKQDLPASDSDGLNIPAHDNGETITMPVGVSGGKETYHRETLNTGDVSTTVYRHESLTREQAFTLLVEYYRAWRANRPGGRRF